MRNFVSYGSAKLQAHSSSFASAATSKGPTTDERLMPLDGPRNRTAEEPERGNSRGFGYSYGDGRSRMNGKDSVYRRDSSRVSVDQLLQWWEEEEEAIGGDQDSIYRRDASRVSIDQLLQWWEEEEAVVGDKDLVYRRDASRVSFAPPPQPVAPSPPSPHLLPSSSSSSSPAIVDGGSIEGNSKGRGRERGKGGESKR